MTVKKLTVVRQLPSHSYWSQTSRLVLNLDTDTVHFIIFNSIVQFGGNTVDRNLIQLYYIHIYDSSVHTILIHQNITMLRIVLFVSTIMMIKQLLVITNTFRMYTLEPSTDNCIMSYNTMDRTKWLNKVI